MLTYLEFVIIMIVGVLFLKPKDIIYLLSFIKDVVTKVKHFLYVGKNELNKIIDETKISDLKEEAEKVLNTQDIKDTKKIIKETKTKLETDVSELYQSTNLNYNLDNILKNNLTHNKPSDNSKSSE